MEKRLCRKAQPRTAAGEIKPLKRERDSLLTNGLDASYCQLDVPVGLQVLIGGFLWRCRKCTCCHGTGRRREARLGGKAQRRCEVIMGRMGEGGREGDPEGRVKQCCRYACH